MNSLNSILDIARCSKTSVTKTKTDANVFTTYTKTLKLEIIEDGKMTFKRTNVSNHFVDLVTNIFGLLGFQIYPIEFVGRLNKKGEATLNLSERGYSIFGSKTPIKFECKIDRNLNIHLRAVEYEWELMGNYYIEELTGQLNKKNKSIHSSR